MSDALASSRREQISQCSSHMSRAEQWFSWWGGLVCMAAGFALLRECLAPGSPWHRITAFGYVILSRLSLIGLSLTVVPLVWYRVRNPRIAQRRVHLVNVVWLRVLVVVAVASLTGEMFLRLAFRDGATFSANTGPIVRRFAPGIDPTVEFVNPTITIFQRVDSLRTRGKGQTG